MFRACPIVVVSLFVLVGGGNAQTDTAQINEWREDLRFVAHALPAHHVDAFANITQADWGSAVARLDARLPSLRQTEWLVELSRLVAMLGDAHTGVNPVFDPQLGMRSYPLELYLFDDGLFVRLASAGTAHLAGAKILRIGRVSAEEAIDAVAPTISHENEWWIRAQAPARLMVPEILDGLGLVDDMERLPLVVERGGAIDTVIVSPAGPIQAGGHGHQASRANWVDMMRADPPLWLTHMDRPFSYEYQPDTKLLYVGYRAVVSPDHGQSNREFWDEVFATADANEVTRFVIDIRANGGGNGFFNRNVVQQILRRPVLDRPDVLYVIIGRATFSAAQQLANELDWWTQATFVGEPTGQRPSQFGDATTLELPNSGIRVRVSTVFHQGPTPFDRRQFIPPAVYVPLTSAHYRNGVDPVLQAILERGDETPVTHAVASAVRAGDIDGARRALTTAIHAPENRFREFEADINRLGYELLGTGELEAAIAVFQLNVDAFPESANVYDSLGEGLERAGRREEALAAYRKALTIDPTYPSSLAAIRRLGGR